MSLDGVGHSKPGTLREVGGGGRGEADTAEGRMGVVMGAGPCMKG